MNLNRAKAVAHNLFDLEELEPQLFLRGIHLMIPVTFPQSCSLSCSSAVAAAACSPDLELLNNHHKPISILKIRLKEDIHILIILPNSCD